MLDGVTSVQGMHSQRMSEDLSRAFGESGLPSRISLLPRRPYWDFGLRQNQNFLSQGRCAPDFLEPE